VSKGEEVGQGEEEVIHTIEMEGGVKIFYKPTGCEEIDGKVADLVGKLERFLQFAVVEPVEIFIF
jgi:hypothetical protein